MLALVAVLAMPAAVAAPTPTGAVRVHIESPQAVDLEVAGEGHTWRKVCSSPCDAVLPADAIYRIDADGIRPSKPFHLTASETENLEVEPASSTAHGFALAVVVTGVVGVTPAVGVTALVVAGLAAGAVLICPILAAIKYQSSWQSCMGDIVVGGGRLYAKPYVWIPGVSGAALIIGGGLGLRATASTSVNATTGAQPPGATSRVPAWADLSDRTAALFEPKGVVPLVRIAF